jgi:hypothetical protein
LIIVLQLQLSSDATTQARLEPWRRHLAQLSNVLVTLNSAVNFLIYCFFSRNFRSVLKRQFGVFNLKHFYRRTVSGSGQDDAHGCCTRYWWSRCWFGTEHRRRHRHSTGGDTGDNTGGSKRSTTLLSDSRSNGMSTRLTPIPCGVQFGENGKAHTVNGISFYGQIAAAADVVPCL